MLLGSVPAAAMMEDPQHLRGLKKDKAQQSSGSSYIVVLKNEKNANVAQQAQDIVQEHQNVQVGYLYETALQGFSFTLPNEVAAEAVLLAMEQKPNVAYIEQDAVVSITAQTVPPGIRRSFAPENSEFCKGGNVDAVVAIIDSGVDLNHPDLNVVNGVNCMLTTRGPFGSSYCGSGGDDDNGHGTHVAGTVGAINNDFGVVGVAPGAGIVAVKVLDSRGSGYTSGVIAGIDWVAANADSIDVANMSLVGSGFSTSIYEAIERAVVAGVAFAVAAGNDNDDASKYSPAAFDNVLTVSALADFDGEPGNDSLASFSNTGSAVDIAAPGVSILSTIPGGYDTYSGTSMASPHVAGALALLVAGKVGSGRGLYSKLIEMGDNWSGGSGEPSLNVGDDGCDGAAATATDSPPSVSITNPSNGNTYTVGDSISFTGTATDPEDGDLTAYLVWTSDIDGEIGTSLTAGTHIVTASVTDSSGNTNSDSITIIVNPAGGGGTGSGINLEITIYKVKGVHHADLAWNSGDFTNDTVSIFRDGVQVGTTEKAKGSYTDNIEQKGGGVIYVYKICDDNACSVDGNAIF